MSFCATNLSARRYLVALAAVASIGSCFMANMPAAAEGALVVGIPDGGLRNGFAYGYSLNKKDPGEALKIATAKCREEAKKQDFELSRCKVVETFSDKCVAVAMDPEDRWAGWSVASDLKEATAAAIAKCAKNAKACKLDNSDCDTK